MILFYLSTVNIEFPHSNYYTCARCNSMSKTDTTLARKEIESQTKPRNCAWLIKGVVKREIIQMAERDDELKVVFDGTGSVYDRPQRSIETIALFDQCIGPKPSKTIESDGSNIKKTSYNHWWQWSAAQKTFNGDGLLKNHWKFAMVSSLFWTPAISTSMPLKKMFCKE